MFILEGLSDYADFFSPNLFLLYCFYKFRQQKQGHLHCLGKIATLEKSRHFGASCLATTPKLSRNIARKIPSRSAIFLKCREVSSEVSSVNGNRRNVTIFHHVTLGTSGLLRALFETFIVILGPHTACAACLHACTVTVPVPPLLSPSLSLLDYRLYSSFRLLTFNLCC